MPDYRLYLMNLHSGHIEGAETFQSADDDEALGHVNQRNLEGPAELWCGARKVARFEARSEIGA